MVNSLIDNPTMLLILISGIAIAAFLLYTPKMSNSSIRNAITDYNNLLSEYNTVVQKISNIQNNISEVRIISTSHLEDINVISQNINTMCQQYLNTNDKVVKYIKNKNLKKYKEHKNMLARYIYDLNDMYEKLYAIYEEAVVYEQKMEEEQYYKNYYNSYVDEESSYEYDSYEKRFEGQNLSQDVFFIGCNTEDEIKKRYKSLAKVYHPDMPTGDTHTFQQVNNEYEKRLKEFE